MDLEGAWVSAFGARNSVLGQRRPLHNLQDCRGEFCAKTLGFWLSFFFLAIFVICYRKN